MKKIHYLCLGLALVLAPVSCGKDDPNPPDDPTTNPPTIASFSPTEGTPGTTVEIIGTNFSATASENTVKFNETIASVGIATATKLTVSVPNGATSGKIAVTVDGETAQSSGTFTVTEPSANAPTIDSFEPLTGPPGTQVYIYGSNFSTTAADNLVRFNGIQATVLQAESNALVVTVPSGAETGVITVTVNGQTAQNNNAFTVTNPPQVSISFFTPVQENVGAQVSIVGANFNPDPANNSVEFNGVTAQVTAATSTNLTVIVPEGATTGTITVTVGQQTVESATAFTVGPWRKLADFPGEARRGAVIATLEDENPVILAGLGYGLNSGQLNDMWSYNPQTNEWEEQTAFPHEARNGAYSFVIENTWFVGGGYDGQGNPNDTYAKLINSPWSVNQTTLPNIPGSQSASFVLNNKGYVFGGTGIAYLQEYDPIAFSWTNKTNLGFFERDDPVGFAINGKGYIATGFTEGYYLRDLHLYDPDSNVWSEMKSLDDGMERYGAIGFAINGKGYLSTGVNFTTSTYFNDMWEYNPDTDTWTAKTSYPGSGRYGASVTTIDGKAYIVFGEGDGSDNNDFWEYTPALDN